MQIYAIYLFIYTYTCTHTYIYIDMKVKQWTPELLLVNLFSPQNAFV